MVSRSEIDMLDIREIFRTKYEKSLHHMIEVTIEWLPCKWVVTKKLRKSSAMSSSLSWHIPHATCLILDREHQNYVTSGNSLSWAIFLKRQNCFSPAPPQLVSNAFGNFGFWKHSGRGEGRNACHILTPPRSHSHFRMLSVTVYSVKTMFTGCSIFTLNV